MERRMEKVILFIYAASALSDVSSLPARQYYFVYEQKTWTEAQSYCREKFTALVPIDNMEDVEILNSMAESEMMEGRYVEKAWIGLFDDVNSWRWSMSDRTFYKDIEIKFRNWGRNQPDNYGEKERCTRMADSGQWLDVPCHYSYNSVCADIRGKNVTFVYVDKEMKFIEAQDYCRKQHTDLASVRNMAENQKIQELVLARKTAWIGLFRDSWKWIDGRKLSFSHWMSGQPYGTSQNCVGTNFKDSGKWADWSCDTKSAFICYNVRYSKQVVKMKLARRTTLDLNDFDVQEELLKQFKQKLKEQGVMGDIKLSWRTRKDGKIFHNDGKRKGAENVKHLLH